MIEIVKKIEREINSQREKTDRGRERERKEMAEMVVDTLF